MLSILAIDKLFIQIDIASLILLKRFIIILSLQRIVSDQQHVCNYSKAKYIAFRPIRFFTFPCIFNYFRSHVSHRAASLVRFDADCFIEIERKSKINDEWFEVGEIDEDILWFEISMDNVCLVDISDSL